MDPHRTTGIATPASAWLSAAPVKAMVSVPWVTTTPWPPKDATASMIRFQWSGPISALSTSGSKAMTVRVVPAGASAPRAVSTTPGAGWSPPGPGTIPIVPPV